MELENLQEQMRAMQTEIAALKSAAARPTRRPKRSRAARLAMAAALFLIPVIAFGVTITKPYTFVSGQPISASELNDNFDTVYDRVNELGMYKVKAGSTVLGDAVAVASGKSAYFITEEGYVSIAGETRAGTISLGAYVYFTYHTVSNCSDTPILTYNYTKTVANILQYPNTSLYYGTGTQPGSVPGYIKYVSSGTCTTNTSAGSQTTADFTTSAANNESVTGVPNSISGTFSIVLE